MKYFRLIAILFCAFWITSCGRALILRRDSPITPPSTTPTYACSGNTTAQFVAADPTATYLFNGTGTPESQGWIRLAENGFDTASANVVITPKGTNNSQYYSSTTQNGGMNEYLRDSGASDNFYVAMRVAVTSGTSNLYDAGFAFSPIGSNDPTHYDFVWTERSYGLFISPCQIGFQDYSATYDLNATIFHTYLIVYKNSFIKVYVDASYPEVLAGTALPVLSRATGSYDALRSPGIIVFGDTSNDTGTLGTYNQIANSSFQLDYVTFKAI